MLAKASFPHIPLGTVSKMLADSPEIRPKSARQSNSLNVAIEMGGSVCGDMLGENVSKSRPFAPRTTSDTRAALRRRN